MSIAERRTGLAPGVNADLRGEYIHAAAFSDVVEALGEYSSIDEKPLLSLGGWEAEDPSCSPPAFLIEALAAIPTRLHSYSYLRDLAGAKEMAAEVFAGGHIHLGACRPRPNNVAILPNSTQALLVTLATLKTLGITRVVVAAPSYFAATEACRHLGLELSIVPAADFITGALDVPALTAAMQERKSALLVTNPAYSIGVEYGWSCLTSLFAALSEGSLVVLDETRLGLHWTDEAPWYTADYPAEVVVIRSPSKVFFVDGQKCSVVLGPPALISALERTSEALLGSLPGVAEPIAVAYLAAWRSWIEELTAHRVGPLRRWRRRVIATFKRNWRTASYHLQPRGFTLSPVNSGPYLLAGAEARPDLWRDCYAVAREDGVLMMDSTYFFHQRSGWTGFRVNLSGRPPYIAEAVTRIFPQEQSVAR